MDAVVAEFAGAPVPEPVPVVMDDIVMECLFWRGSLPQGIIEPLWDWGRLAAADVPAIAGWDCACNGAAKARSKAAVRNLLAL